MRKRKKHTGGGHNEDVNPIKYLDAKNQGRMEGRQVVNHDKNSCSINRKA